MRAPQTDGVAAKTWARIAAGALLALAALVTFWSVARHPAPQRPTLPIPAAAADPLVGELYRCQVLGQAGADDARCLAAWAENRRRFLSPDARPEAVMPPAAGEAQ